YFVTNKFESDVHSRFREKTETIAEYLSTKPEIFFQKKITGTKVLEEILKINKASYLVFENASNEVFGGINYEIAEASYYMIKDDNESIKKDQDIYRTSAPVYVRNIDIGKIYTAFNSEGVGKSVIDNKIYTALFCIGLFAAGILFTYMLSSFSLRPLTKAFQRLDKAIRIKRPVSKNENNNDDMKSLADRVDIVLN